MKYVFCTDGVLRENEISTLKKESCRAFSNYLDIMLEKGYDLIKDKEFLIQNFDDNFYEILLDLKSKGIFVDDIIAYNKQMGVI